MMIEADVVKGSLFGQSEIQPIMAHPPETQSDLSLTEFIEMVWPVNAQDIFSQLVARFLCF